MSSDMYPDAAIEHMLEQQPEEGRIILDEVPLMIETTYHNGGEDERSVHIPLEAGCEPFILFKMRQSEGAVVLDVTASLIEGEDDLIETLEVFFETMLEERAQRNLVNVSEMVDQAVEEYLDEQAASDD